MAEDAHKKNFTFATPDGIDLFVYHWPCDHRRAVVHVVHGMSEHAARYARLAERLVGQGYEVYAHDQRGHGRSVGPGQKHGHLADVHGWNRAVRDIHRLNRFIAQRHPDVPIMLLAHSMGSFMAQQLLFEHPRDVAGVALSGSNGPPAPIVHAGRVVARIERARVGPSETSSLLQHLSFGDFNKGFEGRTDSDWLSRDQAEVDRYLADPLCGFAITTQTWVDLLDALPRIAAPRNQARVPVDLPIYLFAGELDPVGDRGAGVRRLAEAYRKAGIRDVQLKLYPEARHEVLNETNREEVMGDFVRWLHRVTDRHPAAQRGQVVEA